VRKLIPLAFALCLVPLPAVSQIDESWAAVETVEVQAPPGPAVWHLTRGASEVWILGTVGAMPEGLSWNRQYLSELLDGAREILMPPRPSVGILEGAWFLLTNGSKLSLPRGQALEATLPADLRAHFIATRTAIGRSESRYKTDTPIRAAVRLQTDFQDKTRLYAWEPSHTIRDLADAKHVKISNVAKYEIVDAMKEVLRLDPGQQQHCLAQAVEDIDRLTAHADIAARAWAVGDIATVKQHYAESRLYDCVIAAVQSVANFNERQITDYTNAIDTALNQPGKTIVAIGIGPLLRQNGVLQRLKARHIAIEGPGD
jgi:uncharacterized protein YbaP (TraB family)